MLKCKPFIILADRDFSTELLNRCSCYKSKRLSCNTQDQKCSNSIVQCKHWILCVSISVSKWNEKLGQMEGSIGKIINIANPLRSTAKLMILIHPLSVAFYSLTPNGMGQALLMSKCTSSHRLKYLKQKALVCSSFSLSFHHHFHLLCFYLLHNFTMVWGSFRVFGGPLGVFWGPLRSLAHPTK